MILLHLALLIAVAAIWLNVIDVIDERARRAELDYPTEPLPELPE